MDSSFKRFTMIKQILIHDDFAIGAIRQFNCLSDAVRIVKIDEMFSHKTYFNKRH